MKLTTATIEMKASDLTRHIVGQFDTFDSLPYTKDNIKDFVKPVARVSMATSDYVLFETPRGIQKMSRSGWLNNAPTWEGYFGKWDDIPKVILLK